MKSLVAGFLVVLVALASVLSCCHADRTRDDEYYELMDWLSAVKRGSSKGFGRNRPCKVDKDNAHGCRRGYSCNSLAGGPCRPTSKYCRCVIHDDISWLL